MISRKTCRSSRSNAGRELEAPDPLRGVLVHVYMYICEVLPYALVFWVTSLIYGANSLLVYLPRPTNFMCYTIKLCVILLSYVLLIMVPFPPSSM